MVDFFLYQLLLYFELIKYFCINIFIYIFEQIKKMKLKLYLFLALLIFNSLNIFSQTPNEISIIETLERQIDSTDVKIDQIKLNLKIAEIYLPYNTSKTLDYLDIIDKLTKKTTPQPLLFARIYSIYGNAYYKTGNSKKAIKYYEKQLKVLNDAGYTNKTDSITFNLAAVAYQEKQYNKSEDYYKIILTKAITDQNTDLEARLYQSLYNVKFAQKKYKEALEYLNNYLRIVDSRFYNATQKINILSSQVKVSSVQLHNTQSQLVLTQNVLVETNSDLQDVTGQKDSLVIDTTLKAEQIDSLETAKQLKERELERQKYKNELQQQRSILQEQRLNAKKKLISLLSLIIIIIGIAGFFILFLYRRIKKQNKILHQQKTEISKQRDEIKHKNTQITESIFYASRIQKSILPTEATITSHFPKSFTFFRPRDIVSGDFYWFTKHNDVLFISVIDCTGHGVPGAFISMIGNTLLNKIVNENNIFIPADILSNLHEEMKAALQQTDKDDDTEDGMDMVICAIMPKENQLIFAGAKNSLLILENDEFKSIKGDFFSIGEKPLRPGMKTSFKNHIINYSNDTRIFLSTDGIVDQFGGKDKEKKFNYSGLKNLILANKNSDYSKIGDNFDTEMKNWIGEGEQTDDMLVIGIDLSEVKI